MAGKAGSPPSPPPLPPSDGEPEDSIAQFQDRAKPILSQSGGFANVECLLKLKGLSQELGLSEEEFDEAIASMRGEAPTGAEAVERQRREKRFLKRLRKTLKLQQGNILSFRQRQNLVDAGVEGKHALPKPAADRLIDQVAREEKVRFTTLEDAQQYVAQLIRQVMGESPVLDNNMRRRIWREGKKSGLTRGEIEDIIRKRATVNRLHDWSNWIAPGAGILAVLATVLFLVYLGYSNLSGGSVDVPDTDPTTSSTEEDPKNAHGDDWYDWQLAVAMANAPSDLQPTLDRISFNDPALRAGAYESLINQLFDKQATKKVWENNDRANATRAILAGCYALDPSDEAAGRLRDALLAVIPAGADDPAGPATDYEPIYWAMEAAVAILGHKGLDPQRADALALAIGERVQANFDRRLSPRKRAWQSKVALTTHLYRLLVDSVKANPQSALDQRDALKAIGLRYVPRETRQSFDTDILIEVLSANEDGWKEHEKDIEHYVLYFAEPNMLKLFAFFRRCSNTELQTFLAERLCIRVGVAPKSMSVKDVTRAISDKIGVVAGDRRQMLEGRVKSELDGLSATPEKPRALLNETIRLAHLAMLGCALAQGDLGHKEFDEGLAAFERRTDGGVDDDADTPDDGPSDTLPPWANQRVSYLSLSRGNVTDRMKCVDELAGITSSVEDLTPAQGFLLAGYLLKLKTKNEYDRLSPYIAKLGRWKSVRLGLADVLAAGRLRDAGETRKRKALETVETVLGKRFTPVAKRPWAEQQRILSLFLLRDVYEKLGTGRPSETKTPAFDEAQKELTEFYRAEARLLGLPPQIYSTMASPGEALQAMIKHLAAKLQAGALRPRDKKVLDNLPHELAAAQYLGENSLANTVLLQRIWARLLAISVAVQNPVREDRAKKVLEDLQASDGRATHVLTQLRDGEAALLQMWLFLSEKEQ